MTLSFSMDLETFILDVRERAVAARAPEALIAKLDEVLERQDLADGDQIEELKEDLEEAGKEIESLREELKETHDELEDAQECRDDLAEALANLIASCDDDNVREAQAALKRSGPQR